MKEKCKRNFLERTGEGYKPKKEIKGRENNYSNLVIKER